MTLIEAGVWLLVGLTAALTVLVAALLWRDGYIRGWRAARERPPMCPKCRYNLSGLTACRCPECGTPYRLEELWKNALIAGRDAPADADRSDPAGQKDTGS